jgi:hypothetical protein
MSGPIPLELQSKIANWRLRAAEGTLSLDELKGAVTYLRAGRMAASQAAGMICLLSWRGYEYPTESYFQAEQARTAYRLESYF